MICLVHLAVGSLDKAVLVYASIGRKRVDKTDVLSLGGFYRAHSRIVRVVNVADVEGRALAVKTAGAQRGELSLVRKFCNRVGLVHELRQLRGAEKLLDCAGHRTDIDKVLRRGRLGVVLNLHALAHYSFKTRDTDAELVLQKFAYASHSAVAEVVDVVAVAYARVKSLDVVNRRDNVVDEQVFYHQLVVVLDDELFELVVVAVRLVEDALQRRVVNLFVDAQRFRVEIHKPGNIDVTVAVDVERALLFAHGDAHAVDACVLNAVSHLFGNALTLLDVHHAVAVDDCLGCAEARDTSRKRKLFVEFISAHTREVVPSSVEEQASRELLDGVDVGNLAGAQLAVELFKSVVLGLVRVFVDGVRHQRFAHEELGHRLVVRERLVGLGAG